MKLKRTVALILLVIAAFSTGAKNYYLDHVNGNDENSGSRENGAWQNLSKIEQLNLQPGDTVFFARGSEWTKAAWEAAFVIDDSGTSENPIVFTAFGSGEKPSFTNGGQKWNKGIKVMASHVIIENIMVKNTGHAAIELTEDADFNSIRNCEITNCGVGIWVYGRNNLLTQNYIHDLKMVVDDEAPDNDFGCVSFWLYGPGNEVSYNRSINNVGHSYDYIHDGGFIEFYENGDSTYAHHNWVETGNGICEASLGHGKDIVFSYNVFIENKGMFAFHTNNFKLENFRFENNTCITREGTEWNNMYNWWADDLNEGMITMRNNIFVYGGGTSEEVTKSNNYVHENNIYHLLDGAGLGALKLHETEKLADPMFLDEENKDFRLKDNSPAIDAGANLGYDKDFDDNKVPSGEAPEIGAFEFMDPSAGFQNY